jgi:hypothetical protein
VTADAIAPPTAVAAPVQLASFSPPPAQAGSLNLPHVLPSAAADPVAQRLQQIDAQLAAMLAQSPSTWNTTALYGELQTLTTTAPTAEQRTQAQNLWWRVAKCQQVQQGYTQFSLPPVAAPPSVLPATAAFATPPAQQLPLVAQANFAAPLAPSPQPVGELQPLVSRLKEIATTLNSNMQQQRTYTSTLRNRSASSMPLASGEPAQSALASAVTEVPAADPEAEAGGYAGTGWLMPLVSRSQLPRDARDGVPPFALTDDDGNVKFLVTPSPGLSVSEYARKRVGVIGPVGQLPGLRSPHLTAQRVVVLERHE